jgi:thioredoxin-dependent peroxiredoxin
MGTAAYEERKGIVTFKGNPVTLVGPELKVGDQAPEFDLFTNDLQPFKLSDALAGGSRAALIIIVPSIDTSVCSLETVKFNRQTAELAKDKVATFTVSVDLPFAQKRWSSTEKVDNVQLLSDYKEHSFGPTWGVFIKELGLLARSIFLVDKTGVIRYVEIVPEVAQEPNYDEVLSAATSLAG